MITHPVYRGDKDSRGNEFKVCSARSEKAFLEALRAMYVVALYERERAFTKFGVRVRFTAYNRLSTNVTAGVIEKLRISEYGEAYSNRNAVSSKQEETPAWYGVDSAPPIPIVIAQAEPSPVGMGGQSGGAGASSSWDDAGGSPTRD